MALGAAYEEEAIQALMNTPTVSKPAPQKASVWRTLPEDIGRSATGLAMGGARALTEIAATGADIVGSIRATGIAAPEERRQMQRTGAPISSYSSELGDYLRSAGSIFAPDPVTASAAEQVLYGFGRGATKIVGGALAAGPVGVLAAGAEEAVTQSDALRLQGVDFNARTQAGAVQGAGLALAALPIIGQTKLATAGLYAIGGPGGFITQQAATREILQRAGYDQVAEQFDPFDPVGLAVATLLPAGFAAYGLRQQRLQRAADSLPDLPPRAEAAPPADPAAPPAPMPSRPSAVADAVRSYPTEAVDAARVVLLAERRAAANPGAPDNLRAMDQHEAALTRAEDQIAAGEPVRVADVAPEIAAIPAASDAPTLAGAYRDGSKWSAVYRTVQRTDGSVALVRDFTDDSGTRVQHLRDDGTWADGEPPRTALQLGAGVEQKSGVESFPSAEAALRHAVEVEGATRPAPRVTAAIRALPVDTVSRRAETFGENNNITRQIYVSDMAPRDGLRVLSYPDGRRFVQTVEIAPEARGKGIGQALYVAALQDGPIEIRPQFRSADATRVYDALQRKGIAEVVQRDGREFLQLRVGAEGAPANFPAWADQITSAIREMQAQARPTDAPVTPPQPGAMVTDARPIVTNKAGEVFIDTRGTGVRLHGTGKPIAALSDEYALSGDSRNIYGQGFYTTDAADIAAGYMKKGGRNATLYEVRVREDARLYDMEQPMSPEVVQIARDNMGDDFPTENGETGRPLTTLREVYDEYRAESRNNGLSRDDVQEVFDGIRYRLEAQGYAGFQHIGGAATGNRAHTVQILWMPERDVTITPISLDQFKPNAPTTTQAANPEAAAPARGAGNPTAAAGAADAGRPAAGVEAAGLTPEQARAAVEAAKADVIALRKRESILKSLLECLNG